MFPRPYLAEFNTHRMLSRNSESSRALPPELQIPRVLDNPYIPEFRERTKGMGGGEFLTGDVLESATAAWLYARDRAVDAAEVLRKFAKDDANRVLEPFAWHTAIVTATEWDNFLNLRDHKDAAIPMLRLAQKMREAFAMSRPAVVQDGGWHLPLVSDLEFAAVSGWQPMPEGAIFGAHVSAGRCARSSYSNHRSPETPNQSAARWATLSQCGHWSPGEHAAACMPGSDWIGNFQGWKQLRKHYEGEAIFRG